MTATGASAASRPEFTIVDMRSGRGLGGHCYDYLMALQSAFANREVAVIAPFIGPDAVKNTRLNVYLRGFSAYRRAIADGGVGVVHNSSLNDYVCLTAAAATLRRSRRGFCLMMLYRDPSVESFGAGGPAINRATIWLVKRLIRKGLLRPASDSPLVLDHWLQQTAATAGAVVPTPPLPTAGESEGFELPDHDGPLVVIPGRMRAEKGAANYPAVVRAVLSGLNDGAIAIQTAESDEQSAAALAEIKREFAGDPRVMLIDQHLSGNEYAGLLAAADVAVLPYDTASYGAGSSGVVGDALASGTVVVASPIEWIRLEYGGDERVVLIDDPTATDSIAAGLREALERKRQGVAATSDDEAFSERWNQALDEAIAARDQALPR